MSLKSKIVSAKNKTVTFISEHKQEFINTALIGATIGTVITLRAVYERLNDHADVINSNADTIENVAEHLLVFEQDEEGTFRPVTTLKDQTTKE